MRSGPACEFERADEHEYWRYFLLEQRGEESYGHRGVVDVAPGIDVPGQQIFAEAYPGGEGREARWPVYATAPFPTNLERILDKGPPPRAEFVASAEYEDVNSTYWRGLVTSVENEWYGTQAGSVVDVLILQSNYPADIVKTVVEADNANWFFTNVYGPLAASQAAGAAPIIKAWLAGEELPATFP